MAAMTLNSLSLAQAAGLLASTLGTPETVRPPDVGQRWVAWLVSPKALEERNKALAVLKVDRVLVHGQLPSLALLPSIK